MSDSSLVSDRQRRRWERSRGPRISGSSYFIIGLVIGLALALTYAWILEPVRFTEASPARLRSQYIEEYILLVSQSYQADGNWELAKERLDALGTVDTNQLIIDQLEKFMRTGQSSSDLNSLSLLARRAGIESRVVDIFIPLSTPTFGSQIATEPTDQGESEGIMEVDEPVLIMTSTPQLKSTATPAPSPTVIPPYRQLKREKLCRQGGPIPRIEVIVLDSRLEPMPGVEVLVSWEGGQDHFYTGLKPELGKGYGDVEVEPDISYELMIVGGSQVVDDLRLETCDAIAGGFIGGWRLTFQNTDVFQE